MISWVTPHIQHIILLSFHSHLTKTLLLLPMFRYHTGEHSWHLHQTPYPSWEHSRAKFRQECLMFLSSISNPCQRSSLRSITSTDSNPQLAEFVSYLYGFTAHCHRFHRSSVKGSNLSRTLFRLKFFFSWISTATHSTSIHFLSTHSFKSLN